MALFLGDWVWLIVFSYTGQLTVAYRTLQHFLLLRRAAGVHALLARKYAAAP